MKVFLDTNVLIDFFASRNDYRSAATIVTLGRKGKFELLVSSLSFATASYILSAHHKKPKNEVCRMFNSFICMCNITLVDATTIAEALSSDFDDFEDAMQYHSLRFQFSSQANF